MKISTGSILDGLLDGGLELDSITTIYGPPASGKTCICLLCTIEIAKSKKVIYVDSSDNFSLERLKQLSNDYEKILKNIFLNRPRDLSMQKKFFEKLLVNEKIGIIIVDSISKFYRLDLANSFDKQQVNKDFGNMLDKILELAKKKMVPFLFTSQVYDDFKEKNKISIVGGNWIKNRSDCLIELHISPLGNRKAILVKHPEINEKNIFFKITKEGIKQIIPR